MTISPIRLLKVGIDRWKAATVNRAWGDLLTHPAHGYAADGSDFAGFGTVAALAAEATARGAADAGAVGVSTVFNADGSITDTRSDGVVITTTFGASSITRVIGAPVSKTVTATFSADGSISEVVT